MELAAAWARSPIKAVRDHRRNMNTITTNNASNKREDTDEDDEDDDDDIMEEKLYLDASLLSSTINNSPTRSMDFPVVVIGNDGELEEEDGFGSMPSDRSTIVRQLALSPLIGEITPVQQQQQQDVVTPIVPIARRSRKTKKVLLPTVGEQEHFFEEDATCSVNTNANNITLIKPKKKATSHLPKPSVSERVRALNERAVENAFIGEEDEAIKLYEKGLRIAEKEVSRLKGQLNKSLEKHPVTLASIQKRIQEDMLDLVLLAGRMKTEMTHLYERQGDYENAIETCTVARSLYRKQRKRCPQLPKVPTVATAPAAASSETVASSESENGRVSPDLKSCSASKGSNESDRSIVWYVACPELEKLIKSASMLLDRLVQAKESYEDRKKMIEEIFMLRQEISATINVNDRKKLFASAEAMARNAVAIEKATLGAMHPQVANSLQLLAAITMDQQTFKPGSRDKAIQYLLQGLDVHQTTLGKRHPRTGQDLLRMAKIYQQPVVLGVAPDASGSRQDEDRSIQYYNQAADVFRGVNNGSKVVGSILNDIAVIYVARRDYHQALDLLHESLACYETAIDEEASFSDEMSGASGNSICIDAVQVMRNMGECHMNLRDYSKAIESFVNALDTQREARRKHDSVSESDDLDSSGDEKSFLVHLMLMINDESIADTLRRLGKAFAAAVKFQEAMVVYREAVQIHRTSVNDAMAFARFRFNPELPGKQDQLANTLFCVAEVCLSSQSYENAIRIFNESMQLRIASDGHRPDNQRCNMVHCAMCLVGIANVHAKKQEYVEAHKLYNNALFFCEAQGKCSGMKGNVIFLLCLLTVMNIFFRYPIQPCYRCDD